MAEARPRTGERIGREMRPARRPSASCCCSAEIRPLQRQPIVELISAAMLRPPRTSAPAGGTWRTAKADAAYRRADRWPHAGLLRGRVGQASGPAVRAWNGRTVPLNGSVQSGLIEQATAFRERAKDRRGSTGRWGSLRRCTWPLRSGPSVLRVRHARRGSGPAGSPAFQPRSHPPARRPGLGDGLLSWYEEGRR